MVRGAVFGLRSEKQKTDKTKTLVYWQGILAPNAVDRCFYNSFK